MKLTDPYDKTSEIQALYLCVESWNEIAENNFVRKNLSQLIVKWSPRHQCFACDHYLQGIYEDAPCNNCPFFTYANDSREHSFCEGENSPYYKWIFTFERIYAIEICDLIIDYLNKIEKELDELKESSRKSEQNT